MNGALPHLPSASLTVSALRESIARHYILADPCSWITSLTDARGRKEELWSKQREIVNSVRDNRRTAVYSCHKAGKTCLGARIAAWWIMAHPPGTALVLTSAHSGTQVKVALWRELGRVHARYRLPGRMNQVEWYMTMPAGNEEIVALGRKPSDTDPGSLPGTHAENVLIILDEAQYVPSLLWDGLDSLMSGAGCKQLVFGNPDIPDTPFHKACKPGSGYNVIQISAFDTPNFTGERVSSYLKNQLVSPIWVEEKKKSWGEDNPVYISKVLGRFPTTKEQGLIPIHLISAAQMRNLTPTTPIELGVDVGGGGDKNVIYKRFGPVVRYHHRDNNPDTMQTLSNVLEALKVTCASIAKVDAIGIGKGACDRANEMGTDQSIRRETPELHERAKKVKGVDVGGSARDKESYVNLRAEGYWSLRERFERGDIDIDPEDEDLAAQLASIKAIRKGGRIQINEKKEIRKELGRSPDDADAVMLAFLDPAEKRENKRGRKGKLRAVWRGEKGGREGE